MKERCAFNKVFLDRMWIDTAWPSQTTMQVTIRDRLGGSIRTGEYSKLIRGEAISRRSVHFVVKALLRPEADLHPDLRRAKETIHEFLRMRGVLRPDLLQTAELLELLCDTTNQKTGSSEDDVFLRGLSGFVDVLLTKRLIHRHVQRCDSERDVKTGLRWASVTCGRMLATPGEYLSPEQAVSKLEQHFGNGFTEAHDADINNQIRLVHPWMVVFARGMDGPTGMSVMLPLTAAAYDRYLTGQQSCFEFNADDFVIPSRHLFVKLVAERPLDLGGESVKNSTAALLRCCLAQVAVLTRPSRPPRNEPIRFLSFAAVPGTAARLQAQAYKPMGTKMKGTQLDLMGRTLTVGKAVGKDIAAALVLSYLSLILKHPPQP